jgi:RNA polymerase sigma factor (sigma-70 family)
MTTARSGRILGHFQKALLPADGGGLGDGQLLGQFLAAGDEAAFAALVRRHGPMVLAVCRRLLRHEQDAEDAFQATFVVLARKAAAVVPREAVGAWLYGVARRAALEARSMRARRRLREQQMKEMPQGEVPPEEPGSELRQALDRELSRLPEKYRVPVVLCELEGRPRKEVARQLGLPEGTLSWRLAAARKMLARRLARHGPAVTGLALGALLAECAAAGGVPAPLVLSTVRAATGVSPAGVAALAQGVLKAMLITKLKAAWVVLLVVSVGAGAAGLTYRPASAQSARPAAGPARDDLEALRLEVEALRKSLQATRERVRLLEGELAALKGAKAKASKPAAAKPANPYFEPVTGYTEVPVTFYENLVTAADEPLKAAEGALKKLRKDPGDKEALAALEQAVGRLKKGLGQKPAEGGK